MIETSVGYGGLPAFKAMMRWFGDDCGPCRLPTATLDEASVERLRDDVGEPLAIDRVVFLEPAEVEPVAAELGGEPPRVAPSKKKAALITVAKAEHKDEALAGLERWKAKHPKVAALLAQHATHRRLHRGDDRAAQVARRHAERWLREPAPAPDSLTAARR